MEGEWFQFTLKIPELFLGILLNRTAISYFLRPVPPTQIAKDDSKQL